MKNLIPPNSKGPILLDLFCGAGGASVGYARAGFKTIVGVDRDSQPDYPASVKGVRLHFVKMDVMKLTAADIRQFDAVHASPPCQAYSSIIPEAQRKRFDAKWKAAGKHADLIAPVRRLLKKSGLPYVIENVPGAKKQLRSPITLCGPMFPAANLAVFRRRLFESNVKLTAPMRTCPMKAGSVGALSPKYSVRKPRTERLVGKGDLPKGYKAREVEYPSRKGGRIDLLYYATTKAKERKIREYTRKLGKRTERRYARSLDEVLRIEKKLVKMTPLQIAADRRRYEAELAKQVKPKAPGTVGKQFYPVYGLGDDRGTLKDWQRAMGTPWMKQKRSIAQSIPPVYTEYLGKQLLLNAR